MITQKFSMLLRSFPIAAKAAQRRSFFLTLQKDHKKPVPSYDPLIDVPTLLRMLRSGEKNVRLVDSCWYMPNDPRKPEHEYRKETIPGSVFFDIDKVADQTSPYPHMLPSDSDFVSHMKRLNIRKTDYIVCFDHEGTFSSPRAWFTFQTFGAPNVRVLNGGLQAWKAHGLSLANGLPEPPHLYPQGSFDFARNKSRVVDMKYIHRLVPKIMMGTTNHAILDARSPGRFAGTEEEPRPGLRRGHIPGSVNVPYKDLLNDDGITMKSVPELKRYFEQKGVDARNAATASCGSGLSACAILLALHRIGARKLTLYDGSWSEYVCNSQLTLIQGAFPEPQWQCYSFAYSFCILFEG